MFLCPILSAIWKSLSPARIDKLAVAQYMYAEKYETDYVFNLYKMQMLPAKKLIKSFNDSMVFGHMEIRNI